jgi:hypothetical protein
MSIGRPGTAAIIEQPNLLRVVVVAVRRAAIALRNQAPPLLLELLPIERRRLHRVQQHVGARGGRQRRLARSLTGLLLVALALHASAMWEEGGDRVCVRGGVRGGDGVAGRDGIDEIKSEQKRHREHQFSHVWGKKINSSSLP